MAGISYRPFLVFQPVQLIDIKRMWQDNFNNKKKMTSWLDPRWAEADDVSGADNHTTKKKIIRLKKSSFDKSVESLVFSLWKLRDFSADRVSPPPPIR